MSDSQFFERYGDEIFHLPYLLAQDAIGETDGGIAGVFESDSREHGSGFANAGGHYVIESILARFPSDEVIDRINHANQHDKPEIEQRFASAELLTKAAIPAIAHDVARLWHATLARAFPEIGGLEASSPSTIRALEAYLKVQYAYTDEHEASFSGRASEP
jgi:hypothetical protein